MITTRYREAPIKFANAMTNNRRYCSCGHTINIPDKIEKVVCSWCGNYVFRDKKTEFEYRMKERMNNGK